MRPIIDDMFFMSIFAFILSVLFVTTTVDAQRPGFGKCPDYPAMKDFNITQFQGQWYEIERSFYLMEIPYSCVKFNFTLQQNSFKVTEFAYNRLTGRSTISYGFAKPNYLQPAILNYEVETALPKYLARIMPGSGKYLILHTDYEHYAILYSCSNLGILHADLLWVLGREKDLTVDSRVQVYDHLQTLNINTDRLTLTPRKKCPK